MNVAGNDLSSTDAVHLLDMNLPQAYAESCRYVAPSHSDDVRSHARDFLSLRGECVR